MLRWGHADNTDKAVRSHSGFPLPDLAIAESIRLASSWDTRAAYSTPLASPLGSFGRPIFGFILFVNKMFDNSMTFC